MIEAICNQMPIPARCDMKPIDAIQNIQINNNRDMIKYMLSNWIFVNKYNAACAGGIVTVY